MPEEYKFSPIVIRKDKNGVRIGPEGSAKIGKVTVDSSVQKNVSKNAIEGKIGAGHEDLGSVELYANKDGDNLTIGLEINPSSKLRKLIYKYSAAMGATAGVITYSISSIPDANYKLALSVLTAVAVSLGVLYVGKKLHLV